MGHVEVAAPDDGLLCVQSFQVREEIAIPFHPVIEANKLSARVGNVGGDKIEGFVLHSYDSSLIIVLANSHAEGGAQGSDFAENTSA